MMWMRLLFIYSNVREMVSCAEFRSPVHVSEAEGDSEGPLQESEDSGWITAGNQKGTAPLPPLQLQESEGPDAGESVASEGGNACVLSSAVLHIWCRIRGFLLWSSI